MPNAEFLRINEPRMNRALEQLGFIQKSAGSMKVPQLEVNEMLAPVFKHMAKLTATDRKPEKLEPGPMITATEVEERTATPPVAREISRLEELSTTQLIDRMIACGAILAERRK